MTSAEIQENLSKFGSLPLIAPNLVTNCNKVTDMKEMDP